MEMHRNTVWLYVLLVLLFKKHTFLHFEDHSLNEDFSSSHKNADREENFLETINGHKLKQLETNLWFSFKQSPLFFLCVNVEIALPLPGGFSPFN